MCFIQLDEVRNKKWWTFPQRRKNSANILLSDSDCSIVVSLGTQSVSTPCKFWICQFPQSCEPIKMSLSPSPPPPSLSLILFLWITLTNALTFFYNQSWSEYFVHVSFYTDGRGSLGLFLLLELQVLRVLKICITMRYCNIALQMVVPVVSTAVHEHRHWFTYHLSGIINWYF